MWKSGTFDLEDINETLIDEIVFFDISYPGMGDPGGVIFITKRGDEYIISQSGTEWHIDDIVKLFPDMYEVYQNQENGMKDEYGFTVIGNWKIIPEFAGLFLVRTECFEKFYAVYQTESEFNKKFPCGAARLLFGKERSAPDERMVYIKTQECWDQDIQKEIERKRETEKNRLSDADVPWMKYNDIIWEGYVKFWIRKNNDGTHSGFRWLIQVQKEEYEEGSYKLDAPIECYNLFLQKYENMDAKLINDLEKIYFTYVNCREAGKFVRSYKNLEKAKEAVSIRNEWIGWGNVNKKNVYMIDYEYLKARIEADSQIYIF
jgi:hypothetical protein